MLYPSYLVSDPVFIIIFTFHAILIGLQAFSKFRLGHAHFPKFVSIERLLEMVFFAFCAISRLFDVFPKFGLNHAPRHLRVVLVSHDAMPCLSINSIVRAPKSHDHENILFKDKRVFPTGN